MDQALRNAHTEISLSKPDSVKRITTMSSTLLHRKKTPLKYVKYPDTRGVIKVNVDTPHRL